MSIFLSGKPTTPNVTGTNLVYKLRSINSNKPRFRYVVDIQEVGELENVTRMTVYPNYPNNTLENLGDGIIDVARILNDQLDADYNWKTASSIPASPVRAAKTFIIELGEEYAETIDGPLFTSYGILQEELTVFNGTIFKSSDDISLTYNGSFIGPSNFNPSTIVSGSNILSNTPEAVSNPTPDNYLWVDINDYHTVTLFDPDTFIAANVLDVNGNYLGGVLYDASTRFNTLGIGPQNILATGGISAGNLQLAASIQIEFGGTPKYTLHLNNHPLYPCSEEYTRFAFINQYGFWDYYNIYTPLRKNTNIKRHTYDQLPIDYTSLYPESLLRRRGTKQFRTDYSDVYNITTDYIAKDTADWLIELLKSPEVFIQVDGNFVPINITKNSIDWNMDQYRQKIYQYTIEFTYANQPQPR